MNEEEIKQRVGILSLLRFHLSQILDNTTNLLLYCSLYEINLEQGITSILAHMKAIDEEVKKITEALKEK